MKSESLEFEIRYEGRTFLVSYESESISLNLLMSIIYDNLPIDTITLKMYDVGLFEAIMAAMKNNAQSFWEENITL